MSDLISRQAAIDTLTEYGNGRAVFISVGEAVIRIEQLPPAQPKLPQPWEVLVAQAVLPQPEPHWIPVEQDAPTEDDDYWATFDAETGRFVDWCSWYHGRWVVWLGDIPNDVSNVIAWCKPMEPYKGVTE